jgi:elongation factor Ts
MASAKKREGREASEGRVAIKFSDDKSVAVMVEVNSETDFVARNDEFIELVNNVADQAMANVDKAGDDHLIPSDVLDDTEVKALAGKLGENLGIGRVGALMADGGKIDDYIHPGDQLGVLIVLEGDASALDTGAASSLAHDLAMQIAAANPGFVRKEDVPQEVIDKEVEIYKAQMRNEGKPENILDKIAQGKVNKYFEENCLLQQEYVKEPKTKVSDRIKQAVEEAGGKLDVRSFLRFKVGEGSDS